MLFLAMLTLLSVLFLLGKGFRPSSMLFFVLYHYFFALNMHRVHIQVSDDVLLHSCFEKALLNDGIRQKTTLHLFSVTNVKCKRPTKVFISKTPDAVFKVPSVTTSQYDNHFLFF